MMVEATKARCGDGGDSEKAIMVVEVALAGCGGGGGDGGGGGGMLMVVRMYFSKLNSQKLFFLGFNNECKIVLKLS